MASAIAEADSGSGLYIIPKKETDTGKLREQKRREHAALMARTIDLAFNMDELAGLCFDLGIDYDGLSGESKQAKIRSLVGGFYRQNTLRVMSEFLSSLRPGHRWALEQKKEG